MRDGAAGRPGEETKVREKEEEEVEVAGPGSAAVVAA